MYLILIVWGAEYLAGTINKEGYNPLDFGGVCNLGSLFLHNFVRNPFTKDAYVDMDSLAAATRTAVRILNNIIDKNYFPHEIYRNYQKHMRAIGLGYTGLADMLAMMGVRYDSDKAREFADRILNSILNWAYDESADLARIYGDFDFCDREGHANSPFVKERIKPQIREKIEKYGVRNSKITCAAPTGTISLTFGNNCSSGIEPIFSLSYQRKVKIGGQEDENEQIVEMTDYAYGLYKKMVANGEHVDFAEDEIFVTAMDMNVNDHIKMLAVVAHNVCMSVSKTINVPTDYSFEKTKQIYTDCWKSGIKGCTIFRPNEIRKGILYTEDSKKEEQKEEIVNNYDTIVPVSRKTIGTTHGKTYCKKTACGTLYITINCDDDNNIVETFVHTSKGK